MTLAELPVSPEEQRRLDECVRESIRTPGAIQPHGALLAFDRSTLVISRASDNTETVLGLENALGRSIIDVLGDDLLSDVFAVVDPTQPLSNPLVISVTGGDFDLVAHEVGGLVVVEFEPVLPKGKYPRTSMVYGAIHRIGAAQTVDELWAMTAREMFAITGYDRVTVYRFHDDGHGEVVAEEHVDGMEPYLGLHFPASDIPAQARALYVSKLSRVIANSANVGATLLALRDSDEATTIDLSGAELRSVSPHHLQFMRNMGQFSTVSFSLIHDGNLIGMITCAHRTSRRMPFLLRSGLEVLGSQVALQYGSMTRISLLTRQDAARATRGLLLDQVERVDDLVLALTGEPVTLLDLVRADGAMVIFGGQVASVGLVPDAPGLAQQLSQLARTGPLVSDAVAVDHENLAPLLPGFAGLVLVPFGAEGDCLAWFRRELTQSVSWMGDQSMANRATMLSPRNSFSSWTQSVTDRALPWREATSEAAELCRDLDRALLSRAESRLARLALHDPLTGLPNRRLLMDRLQHALGTLDRGTGTALVFIDLDGFKIINDTLGHDVGDAVLCVVADRLLAATRGLDTVARLGGDEFVVLCENILPGDAEVIARRIVHAVNQPIALGEVGVTVTTSVGITMAASDSTASDVLRDADAAMYRAKAAGKDRSSV